MAYAFSNLMNLADTKKDTSTAPLAKGQALSPASSGTSSAPAAVQNSAPQQTGAVIAQQYEAAKPYLAQQQESAQTKLRGLGTEGVSQIGTQAKDYATKNVFKAPTYESPGGVGGAVQSGNTTDLASMNALLSGVYQGPEAFDAAPEAANRLSSALTGGGAQYLTKSMGGGRGVLENVLGRVGGGRVGQTATEEAGKLGEFAKSSETSTTADVTSQFKGAREGAQKTLRTDLEGLRTGLLGDNAEQDAAEAATYQTETAKDLGRTRGEAQRLADKSLETYFGTGPAGMSRRAAATPLISSAIKEAVTKAQGSKGPRTGRDVVTQGESDQLGRIAGLIGGVAPTATAAADYSGQHQIDPNFIQNLLTKLRGSDAKLPQVTTGGPVSLPPPGQAMLPTDGATYAPPPVPMANTGDMAMGYDPLSEFINGGRR